MAGESGSDVESNRQRDFLTEPCGSFLCEKKMEQVTEFTVNFLDGSASKSDIDAFASKLKAGELDSELNEIKEMIEDQLSYINPLKIKKQAEFHKLGHHNQRVLDALNNIKSSEDVDQALVDFKAIFA